jgi:hypothetical protein
MLKRRTCFNGPRCLIPYNQATGFSRNTVRKKTLKFVFTKALIFQAFYFRKLQRINQMFYPLKANRSIFPVLFNKREIIVHENAAMLQLALDRDLFSETILNKATFCSITR